ncbi:hypothetical protein Hypma_006917 [Hypsizygus marmoreus]|uniref:Uncharacterized protein n=1 Tax=Hypsizygus marmoreus TaxID=39966 RepID=A0A369JXG7_HYPMA|nr:hypothetical protein Hypma_006917 [Hypsizygus marmoreus]
MHPCLPDEPHGPSKVISELQADTILRLSPRSRDLWGYVEEDSAAEAFLIAIGGEDGRWSGHEAFFITAPDILFDEDTNDLKQQYWPNVPIRDGKDVRGRAGLFDCGKAERLLGWVRKDGL